MVACVPACAPAAALAPAVYAVPGVAAKVLSSMPCDRLPDCWCCQLFVNAGLGLALPAVLTFKPNPYSTGELLATLMRAYNFFQAGEMRHAKRSDSSNRNPTITPVLGSYSK